MSEQRVVRARWNDEDRISKLESNIIENILCKLPILDVVRTSILSKDWQYKWTNLSKLVFDDFTLPPHLHQNGDELVNIVYSILQQHDRKAPVEKFSLSVKTMSPKTYPHIDQWIKTLSRTGTLGSFVLEFSEKSNYRINSRLFSCADLRSLHLRFCIVPPLPKKFEHLTDLRLDKVTFNNEGIGNVLAKCPQVSVLHLDGVDRLEINHAPKLQSLTLFAKEIEYIRLNNTPSLLKATLSFSLPPVDQSQNQNHGNNNLNGLSNITNLVVYFPFMKFLGEQGVQSSMPSTFNHLSHLHVHTMRFEDIKLIHSTFGLIKSSPNLEKLVFTSISHQRFDIFAKTRPQFPKLLETMCTKVGDYLETERLSIGKSLKKLRFVEMNNVAGLKAEMQFIKLILGNSPSLEKLEIHLEHNYVDKDRESQISKELLRFPRASAIAEIVY